MRAMWNNEGPAFLTVPEAAAYLRISRGLAYEMTRQYVLTDGKTGLRCVRLGHRVLVPRAHLEAIASNVSEIDPADSPADCL